MYDACLSTYDTVGTATNLNLKTFTTDSTIFVTIPQKKSSAVIILSQTFAERTLWTILNAF